jgi:hypothetical protein
MTSLNSEAMLPSSVPEDSSDEEFDVAWARRVVKQKARNETSTAASTIELPAKRTVRFALSSEQTIDVVSLDESKLNDKQQSKDQNNNHHHEQQNDIVISVINIDDDEKDMPTIDTDNAMSSQITTVYCISCVFICHVYQH